MITKTIKIGRSIYVLIPSTIAKTHNIKERIIVNCEIDNKGDFILRIKKRRR